MGLGVGLSYWWVASIAWFSTELVLCLVDLRLCWVVLA